MTKFGKYTLLEKVAEGGMAEIFVAAHTGPGGFAKLVVIKRILPQLEVSSSFREMLLDEARIAATLSHPNLVQTFEVDTIDGTLYIAMEHLVGEDVRAVTKALGAIGERPSLGAALTIVMESCKGLDYAHQKTFGRRPLGIVHRDLSPRNLFVTYDGSVKVLDFGVARARDRLVETRTGEIKGSLPYMSPEQVRSSREIDHRSDIFSLGIVLWELTTGTRLFRAATDFDILQRIVTEPIPRPSEVVAGYPPALEPIVMRALEREPDARYPSCRALQTALEEVTLGLSVRTGSLILSELMTRLFRERIAAALRLDRELPERLAASRLGSGSVPRKASGGPTVARHLRTRTPASDDSDVTRSDRGPRTTSTSRSRSSLVAGAIETESGLGGRPGASRRYWGGGVAAAALLGFGGWMLLGQQRPSTPSAPLQAQGPALAPAPGPTATTASANAPLATDTGPAAPSGPAAAGSGPLAPGGAAITAVRVELETVPAGALVIRDGVLLGSTPLALVLERGTEPVRMRLEMAGHQVEELEVVPLLERRIVSQLRPLGLAGGLRAVGSGRRAGLRAKASGAGRSTSRPSAGAAPGRRSGPDDLVDPFR